MEPDRQMALLLQQQFDQENSKSSTTDFHLAIKLQDDFNREIATETSTGLSYTQKKKSDNDARCLIDPSWELIDPTPNIYNLFVAFNQRFFWDKLLSVCVSWSKRMTSCAGICSYQGRGGLCSITLSEPLLKLRPRKDLIETLLHEMIHAYLFVTHNNRDRNGHGPEFHNHMYRINKEAGTNITVYHSFHDEVKLYQQHWWRCNGPCQNRKPYFGMVRRATNRAPGPNDRWWDEHSRTCDGKFIKVKEPEKKPKSKKENTVPRNKSLGSDIRNFVPVLKNSVVNPKAEKNIQNTTNVHVLSDSNNSTQNGPKVSQVFSSGNIHGFEKLSTPQKPILNTGASTGNAGSKFKSVNGATRTKSNNNTTIVINKKPSSSKVDANTQPTKLGANTFYGTGNRTSTTKPTNSEDNKNDYSVVRNHWLNKFTSNSATNKRTNLDASMLNGNLKKQKIVENGNQEKHVSVINVEAVDDSNFVNCPVCQKQIQKSSLNDHLDICLEQQAENDKKELCFVCNKEVLQSDYRNHVDNCFDNNIENNDNEELVECEICNVFFIKKRIGAHKKSCIENMFAESSQSSPSFIEPSDDILQQCSTCNSFVETKQFNNHLEKCLLKMFDDLEEKHELKSHDEKVSCLVCNKKVFKSELNIHLDDCMGGVFDSNNDFNEDSKTIETECVENHSCDNTNSENNKYNCPFCMELYSELNMSGHLDQCLTNNMDNSGNKTILIDSFSNDDLQL